MLSNKQKAQNAYKVLYYLAGSGLNGANEADIFKACHLLNGRNYLNEFERKTGVILGRKRIKTLTGAFYTDYFIKDKESAQTLINYISQLSNDSSLLDAEYILSLYPLKEEQTTAEVNKVEKRGIKPPIDLKEYFDALKEWTDRKDRFFDNLTESVKGASLSKEDRGKAYDILAQHNTDYNILTTMIAGYLMNSRPNRRPEFTRFLDALNGLDWVKLAGAHRISDLLEKSIERKKKELLRLEKAVNDQSSSIIQ